MKHTIPRVSFLLVVLLILSSSLAFPGDNTNQKGIDALEEISLGGVKQWILMRGADVTNPILLFLHGGPGFCEMPHTHIDSARLEKHFIVVNWDQRGAGKSYDPNIPKETMNIEQFLSDTHELMHVLRKRFSKDKIFLIGHSWGSVLGLYTAYRHPKSLYAYIGMGQLVNAKEGEMISYQYTVEKAKEAGDEKAIKMLERIGPPPYEGGYQSLFTQRMLLARYGGSMRNLSFTDFVKIRESSPYYTKADNANFMKAFMQSMSLMWDELMTVNFFEDVPELQIPVYFFAGKCDYQVPFELLERYYAVLKAPHKEIVWFENSCHMPNLSDPEAYQDKLINLVLKNTLKK
ncbi:alpha/beta fold hydrolase [Acidobacteriota bacterium]